MNYKTKLALAVSLLFGTATLSLEQPSFAGNIALNGKHTQLQAPSIQTQLPIILAESVHRKKNVLVFTIKCIKPDDKDLQDELYFIIANGNGQSLSRTPRKEMKEGDVWKIEFTDPTFNGGIFELNEYDATPFGDDKIGVYEHKYATTPARYQLVMDGGRSLYEVAIEVKP